MKKNNCALKIIMLRFPHLIFKDSILFLLCFGGTTFSEPGGRAEPYLGLQSLVFLCSFVIWRHCFNSVVVTQKVLTRLRKTKQFCPTWKSIAFCWRHFRHKERDFDIGLKIFIVVTEGKLSRLLRFDYIFIAVKTKSSCNSKNYRSDINRVSGYARVFSLNLYESRSWSWSRSFLWSAR